MTTAAVVFVVDDDPVNESSTPILLSVTVKLPKLDRFFL